MSPTNSHPVRCLILACGNTLRSDDGVGPWLARWAEERFESVPAVRVLSRHQWTPDLAVDVAHAESVIFVDSSVDSSPGEVRIHPVEPTATGPGLASHHVGAPELLALSLELYDSMPRETLLLTIGVGSTELGESFSQSVNDTLPEACDALESAVLSLLSTSA